MFIKLRHFRLNYEPFNPLMGLCSNQNEIYNLISLSDAVASIKTTLFNARALPMSYLN